MENTVTKLVQYEITIECYDIIGKIASKTGLRKSSVVDKLIRLYGEKMINDYKQAELKSYELIKTNQ